MAKRAKKTKIKKSPCDKCRQRESCTEICPKLARFLPSVHQGTNKKEISVDPSRIDKYGNNIEIIGLDPDMRTKSWYGGREV